MVTGVGGRYDLVAQCMPGTLCLICANAGQVVKRAEDEDLNKDVRYHVAFIRNPQGRIITDVRPRPSLLAGHACSACP